MNCYFQYTSDILNIELAAPTSDSIAAPVTLDSGNISFLKATYSIFYLWTK